MRISRFSGQGCSHQLVSEVHAHLRHAPSSLNSGALSRFVPLLCSLGETWVHDSCFGGTCLYASYRLESPCTQTCAPTISHSAGSLTYTFCSVPFSTGFNELPLALHPPPATPESRMSKQLLQWRQVDLAVRLVCHQHDRMRFRSCHVLPERSFFQPACQPFTAEAVHATRPVPRQTVKMTTCLWQRECASQRDRGSAQVCRLLPCTCALRVAAHCALSLHSLDACSAGTSS